MAAMKIKTSEQTVHSQVVKYLKIAYPKLIFHTDFAAGCKMTIGQAIKNASLQSGKSWPDLFIPEPNGQYHGLFIEIKKDIDQIYKKDMTLRGIDHIQEQHQALLRLQEKGYYAVFGCGFDHCKSIIDKYLHPSL